MIFKHAPDWSWARGECAACGMSGRGGVECQLDGEDLRLANERFLGILTRRARQIRELVEDQIASTFRRFGCPHVTEARVG